MGSGIERTLIEANASNVATAVRTKSHAEFYCGVGPCVDLRGYRRAWPKRIVIRGAAVARSTGGAWRESDIHPIVRGAVGIRGVAATGAVTIGSVWRRSGVSARQGSEARGFRLRRRNARETDL